MNTQEKNLRNALKANAVFSLTSGLILILFSKNIAQLMTVSNTQVFPLIGGGLLLFVVSLVLNAYKKNISAFQVKAIIIQDWLWVVASLVLLIFNPFQISMIGNGMIAGVALVVATLAILQNSALNKLK